MENIENRTFDEIIIGESASLTRTLSKDDIALFAVMSGDVNPTHLDERYAETSTFHRIIAHGMWGGALVSAVLGTRLPGPGTIYLTQNLSFRAPVRIGDKVEARVTVTDIIREKARVVLKTVCRVGDIVVIDGDALVMVPVRG